MSLVCVDELKLLKDIERLIKRDISKVVIDNFEPDLSIKPEPINRGRGKQQQVAKKPVAKAAGKNTSSAWNTQRPSFKGRANGQGRTQNRSRSSTQGAR